MWLSLDTVLLTSQKYFLLEAKSKTKFHNTIGSVHLIIAAYPNIAGPKHADVPFNFSENLTKH